MERTPYVLKNWFTDPESFTAAGGNAYPLGYSCLLEAALGPDTVLLYEQEESWEGDWVAVVTDGESIGLVDGYFGSCSGCDALEAAEGSLEGLRDLLCQYLQSVRTFSSWEELRTYLEGLEEDSWEFRRFRSRLLELAEVDLPLAARDIFGCLRRDMPELDPVEVAKRSLLLS